MKKSRSDKHRADVARSLAELHALFGPKPPDPNKTPMLAGTGAGDTREGLQPHDTTALESAQGGDA